MKKTLLLAIQQLSDNAILARGLTANIQAGGSVAHYRDIDRLRIRVLEFLSTIEAFINNRAIKVPELPKDLRPALDRLVQRIASLQSGQDFEKIEAALKAVWGMRDVVQAELVSIGLKSVQTKVESGLSAVRTLEDQAAKGEVSKKRIEISVATSETNSASVADSSKLALVAKKEAETSARAAATALVKAREATSTAEEERSETAKSRKAAQRAADHALLMSQASEKIKKDLSALLEAEGTNIKVQSDRRKELEEILDKTSQKAHKILFEATTAALAEQWRSKRANAQIIASLWLGGLLVFVCLAVLSSVFMTIPQLFGPWLPANYLARLSNDEASFQHSILTKLFIVPPLLFTVWFSASQYAHTRDRQLEYGKRETVAKTLEAYQMYLKGLDPDDDVWQKEVQQLFKSTIEKLYDFLLKPSEAESTPRFSIFGKREASIESIGEAMAKMKSLGITITDVAKP